MSKLHSAVCPACGAEVTVTYWPYNVPLYTVHAARGANRDCPQSLRPLQDDKGEPPPPPRRSPPR